LNIIENISSQIIGRKIQDIKYQSYYFNTELICEFNCLYIKTDLSCWYKFVVDDGYATVEVQNEEPESIIADEYSYIIRNLSFSDIDYCGGIILDIEKYLWNGKEDECCGLFFGIEHEKGFSIIENSEDGICVDVIAGFSKKLFNSCKLISLGKS
jgi:hypothetical protein